MAAKLTGLQEQRWKLKAKKQTNVAILLKERQQSDGSESQALVEILGGGWKSKHGFKSGTKLKIQVYRI
jgi:hypothetical protein